MTPSPSDAVIRHDGGSCLSGSSSTCNACSVVCGTPCPTYPLTFCVEHAAELYFDDFKACFGDKKLRRMTYTPRVPREHNGNHTALNLSFQAAQSAHS